ncbi:hypothetical protein QYE76_022310 [Lolium multiflorum]|uniref:Reverse transcriptase Ty1/copia-type domain-containing protein n=1 Tax=Lolium multiflorum TaxID=4521 RepID=A0AAD8R877_LOLMU|nr:hypothetical protein QYE76_022310 [Lolium multiflorum]
MAYLLLYIDDIILTASTAGLLRQLTDSLRVEFALKDLGPLHYFLASRKAKLSASDGSLASDAPFYRSIVGALQYLTLTLLGSVKPAYDDQILDDPIEFDEVAQSQHDIYARRGRSTSFASELNFVIPDDDTILSQSITRGKKQATRSAYQLKPRGNAPKRYTPDDYVNRGNKVVIEEDETPPRRSTLRKMRNDEPLSSEEEQEQQEQQQQEPRQRTKRLGVRKQPVRRGRRRG